MFDFEIHQLSGLRPSLLVNKLRLNEKTLLLLFAKIRLLDNGCWLWLAAKRKGYGAVRIRAVSKSVMQAHRVCYELVNGRMDDWLDLHHKVEDGCIGPSCVNPDHLLAVTKAEHTRDLTPNSISYKNSHKDECDAGHPFEKENTLILESGGRQCRTCNRERASGVREALRVREKYAKDPARLKTHCFRGHSLTDESNIRWVPGPNGKKNRVCLGCEKIRLDAYKARKEGRPVVIERLSQKHCKRGHVMEGDNIYRHPDGRRSCNACRKLFLMGEFGEAAPTAIVAELGGIGSRKLKTQCKNGHALEGDNVYIKSNGTGRGCVACRLAATKQYQADNREQYLNRRSELRREHKQERDEPAYKKMLAIFAEHIEDDTELIRRLREVMPPAEQ